MNGVRLSSIERERSVGRARAGAACCATQDLLKDTRRVRGGVHSSRGMVVRATVAPCFWDDLAPSRLVTVRRRACFAAPPVAPTPPVMAALAAPLPSDPPPAAAAPFPSPMTAPAAPRVNPSPASLRADTLDTPPCFSRPMPAAAPAGPTLPALPSPALALAAAAAAPAAAAAAAACPVSLWLCLCAACTPHWPRARILRLAASLPSCVSPASAPFHDSWCTSTMGRCRRSCDERGSAGTRCSSTCLRGVQNEPEVGQGWRNRRAAAWTRSAAASA